MYVVVLLFSMLLGLLIIVSIQLYRDSKRNRIERNEKLIKEPKQNILKEQNNYEIPKLKKLTEKQIEDIHARGKITPAEKLKEWEGAGLCAPGDAIEGAAWRCHKFRNCHDCLVDYANTQDEYTSFYDEIEIICK